MHIRRAGTLLALGLAGAALACQPRGAEQSPERTSVDTAAIEAAFDSMRTEFEAAVKAGDFDRQAAIYTADAIYSAPMLPPARGRDSIRAVLEQTTPPGASLEIRPLDWMLLGPDRAYEYGIGTLTFTPAGSDRAVSMGSTYFALFHRTADGWKIHREVLGMNAPPPGGEM